MTWWTDYQARRGQDRKTLYSNNMKNVISNKFESSTSYELVTINGVSRDVRITEESSVTRNPYKKRLLCKPDETIVVGDIVVWDSDNWICTKNDDTSSIVDVGVIEKCNNTLKFYSPTDSTLHTIPCIITNKLTLSDDENKYLTTIDNTFYMLCTSSTTTKEIKPDNIFKLGTYNYQVTTVFDDVTMPGILIFKMKYSEVEATTHSFVTTILNGATASIQQGNTLQLNVEVTDNGVVLSPTPTVTYVSSDITKATISSTGLITAIASTGSCVITATSNSVSDTITVSLVAVPANNYTYSLSSTSTPDTEIKLNQTKTYTATKYNNGVAITQGFTFSVSGEATAYTLTVVDANTCTIKCLKSGYTVVLSATDSSDSSKVVSKTISLKALF